MSNRLRNILMYDQTDMSYKTPRLTVCKMILRYQMNFRKSSYLHKKRVFKKESINDVYHMTNKINSEI